MSKKVVIGKTQELTEEQKTLNQIRSNIYYLENKEKVIARNKEWRKNNKDKVREYERKYRSKRMKNPEFVSKKREKSLKYYYKHKEEIDLKHKEYYANNKEELKLKALKYYQEHREEINRKAKERYLKKKLSKEIKSE